MYYWTYSRPENYRSPARRRLLKRGGQLSGLIPGINHKFTDISTELETYCGAMDLFKNTIIEALFYNKIQNKDISSSI